MSLEQSDTFLSRVFGLHSVYNQLQDKIQYFPELDEEQSVQTPEEPAPETINLLNSDSDLELSLAPPLPLLQPLVKWSVPKKPQLAEGGSTNPSPSNEILPLYHKRPDPPKELVHTQFQRRNRRVLIPPKERALYLWANIVNMDDFLIDVYYYYRGKGFVNIIMTRVVDVLILVFILHFTVFLKWGVDYSKFTHRSSESLTLGDIVRPHYYTTLPFFVQFLLVGFTCYIGLRLVQLYFDYKYRLAELQNFFRQLLGIDNDIELMTIPWSTIVERLMLLKDYNTLTLSAPMAPHYINDLRSKIRLNAHDIANRIMRKENYMIALVNKDILDLSVPFAGLLGTASSKLVLTRTLEWNIKLCINNFVFNENGQVNSLVLKEASRNQMAHELSSRFRLAALINVVLCPFIVVYFVLLYFFRYFNEYKNNPSSLVALRQYTPWAEWKLREFNELPHFFVKRLHLSVGPASTYINQFPGNVFVMNGMTLLNFVAGAITAVLVIMGVLFEDEQHLFWLFELTANRSTLFYISFFGTLWAVTSSTLSMPNDGTNPSFFYDPEASLRYVSQFTHYLPSAWNGRLHTVEVKREFCELYTLKIVLIFNELLSLILTPFVLWFRVSRNASAIIDFFREYLVHVDGLGHVCYFAMFNFEEKDKNMMHDLNKKKKKDPDLNDYYQDDKMIKSYMYFLESYKPVEKKKEPVASSSKDHVPFRPLESIYESTLSLAESVHPPRKKGVFGMINQFSKQRN